MPGLGVVLAVAVVFLTGLLTANMIGQRLVPSWDATLARIPFFKSIYVSVKQVSDTLFSSSGQAFRKALLVQYPRNGSWTIAFQTGTPGGDVANHLHGDYVSVYVPTTPNPTSGFFLMMPRVGRDRAGHDRRRGPQVRHLDGRGRSRAAPTRVVALRRRACTSPVGGAHRRRLRLLLPFDLASLASCAPTTAD